MPQARIGKGTRSRPRNCAWQRETGGFGLRITAAGQKRKPDAGASAGDETLMRQSKDTNRKIGRTGPDIGRQVCPDTSEADGPPEVSQGTGHPHAGESGVGSNAGPICIAVRRRLPFPDSHRAHSPPLHRATSPQRFAAISAQFVPDQHRTSDQAGRPFAFRAFCPLSASPCGMVRT